MMITIPEITPEITQAAAILRSGGLVAFPTETVYGLGADAANQAAIHRIFAVKNRPYEHPLIVHLADSDWLPDWAAVISSQVGVLAKAFWPGPLTMIVKKQPWVLGSVTGGQETVGVRVPSHPMAQAVLRAFGKGVVAPSANQFTHVSPTTAQAVQEELGDRIDLILDGGVCSVGLESTIIDMSGDVPTILRPGMVTADSIAAVLEIPVLTSRQAASVIRVPGAHTLHYAPVTKTRLVAADDMACFIQALSATDLPVAVVMRSEMVLPAEKMVHHVRMPSDATAYAHDLYHTLRSLDHQPFKQIVIESVPAGTDWEAIRDRLFKATAER